VHNPVHRPLSLGRPHACLPPLLLLPYAPPRPQLLPLWHTLVYLRACARALTPPPTIAAPCLQELYEEYFAALRRPGTPLKTFRVKVYVFPALQFETIYAAPDTGLVEARCGTPSAALPRVPGCALR